MKILNKELDYPYNTFLGVDEVGRGCLAGPVVAVAVLIKRSEIGEIKGVNDSKLMPYKKREDIYKQSILKYPYFIGIVGNKTIDEINILNASLLAMYKAAVQNTTKQDVTFIDGPFKIPNFEKEQISAIKGDQNFYSIAVASIIAKVERDRIMEKYSLKYSNFSFGKHKGYGTKLHKEEIKKHGLIKIHRKTFKTD